MKANNNMVSWYKHNKKGWVRYRWGLKEYLRADKVMIEYK